MKKLYRNKENAMLLGVCAGLGDYLEVDATVIRLIFVGLSIFLGMSLFLYLMAALIIPSKIN